MENFEGCQLSLIVPAIAEGEVHDPDLPLTTRLKRRFAPTWNYTVKKYLRWGIKLLNRWASFFHIRIDAIAAPKVDPPAFTLAPGDLVRVKSREEIDKTLNVWKEYKGCGFMDEQYKYCGTTQKVMVIVERFLDERDYKVKKTHGMCILEGAYCYGKPVYGTCDRRCHLFWRWEWLEKVN